MANLVQSLLNESAQNAQQAQFTVAQKLSKKWAKSGLLEGLEGNDQANMAMILESQAKQLVVESSTSGGGTTSGATFTAGNGEQWAGVALPLVRKIFGQIAAKEFVSVQPMNLPAGLVFYLDFQYGNTKDPFTAGDSLYGTRTANFGNAAAGALYGAGRFGYSLNQFSASSGAATIASASQFDIDFNSDLTASLNANEIKKVTFGTSSLANYDINAVRSFIILSGSVTAATNLQQYTSIVSGNIVFLVTGSSTQVSQSSAFTVEYGKATDFNTRGDFEDRTATQGFSVPNAASNTSIVIPEINVQMKSQTISAKTRKLKAQWTPEFAQDLNAYHSIDAEAELTALLSEYVSMEIDLEILDMLITAAPGVTTQAWSAKIGTELAVGLDSFGNMNSITQTTDITNKTAYVKSTWFQTLGNKIQRVSNKIHQLTLRGGANFLVVSPDVATILESIPGYVVNTDGDSAKFAMGVSRVGSFASRFQVYKNPYMVENVILVGFRGNNFLETGAVYAPYIPLVQTPLVYDPINFTPRRGVLTRYAKKVIRPEFYGKVYIGDLDQV